MTNLHLLFVVKRFNCNNEEKKLDEPMRANDAAVKLASFGLKNYSPINNPHRLQKTTILIKYKSQN